MFERVLTATDMLDACDAAVVTALEIAKANKGKLFVLHVMEPSYFHECGPLESVRNFRTGEETATSQEYMDAVRSELDKKCRGALQTYGNYQIEIAYGRPSIEIRRWARKLGADLMVLGPHGGHAARETELIGTLIGNTAEDVIMNTTTPVIITGSLVPRERLDFKKIMVCVDFSPSCSYACEFAVRLAGKYGAGLFPLHVFSGPPDEKKSAESRLKEFCRIPEGMEHEYSVLTGIHPATEILNNARLRDIDLIIMGSRTKEPWKRGYVGSVVEDISVQSHCPIMVVTHPDALKNV